MLSGTPSKSFFSRYSIPHNSINFTVK
jgi:hypothetical protein